MKKFTDAFGYKKIILFRICRQLGFCISGNAVGYLYSQQIYRYYNLFDWLSYLHPFDHLLENRKQYLILHITNHRFSVDFGGSGRVFFLGGLVSGREPLFSSSFRWFGNRQTDRQTDRQTNRQTDRPVRDFRSVRSATAQQQPSGRPTVRRRAAAEKIRKKIPEEVVYNLQIL